MRKLALSLLLAAACPALAGDGGDGWRLVWSDEFDTDGAPNEIVWNYEQGFVRNEEDQWYQPANARCKDGLLVIEARKERRPNPLYEAGSKDWRRSREYIDYTAASINTARKVEFLYGRLEVRARIPVGGGAWPAIWTLGSGLDWPSCGEIDVMECYPVEGEPSLLANAAWGSDRPYNAVWDSSHKPVADFVKADADWASKFHVWRMDWDESAIRLYVDGLLLNTVELKKTVNGKAEGQGVNPFTRPQYILLNLAIGGMNGGDIDDSMMPMKYEIDYVRVYQKKQ